LPCLCFFLKRKKKGKKEKNKKRRNKKKVLQPGMTNISLSHAALGVTLFEAILVLRKLASQINKSIKVVKWD